MSNSQEKTALLLRPHEIKDLISMKEAIDLVEQGYKEAAGNPIINAPRRRVHSPAGVRVSNFPGGIHGLGVIGSLTRAETVTHDPASQVYPYREHPVYLLWDSHSSRLLAIVIGEITEKSIGFSSIMALRTAATSGVGFRHLARKDSQTAGFYGTGGQALHHALALKRERPLKRIKVYSRNADSRKKFAEKLSAFIETEVIPVDSAREVIRGVDVVVCATNSNVPVFDGRWIEPGQHITTVVGSNVSLVKGGWLEKGRTETDDETVRRADTIVTNLRESIVQDQQEAIFGPVQRAIITWDKVAELGEIVNGTVAGRTRADQVTFHANNNGTAAADLAIAMRVYRLARELGRGTSIALSDPGEQ